MTRPRLGRSCLTCSALTWARSRCILAQFQRGADRLAVPKKPGRKEIDRPIVRAYLAHDRDAIALLDSWIRKTVEHKAWNSPSDHEDLIQDVHLRLTKALKNFRFRSSLKTYVQSIACIACVDHYRQTWRIILIPDYPSWLAWAGPTPHEVIEGFEEEKRALALMEAIIQRATQQCRDLFRLIYFENLRHRQIAEIMGLTVSVIKKRAFSCREKARLAFQKRPARGNGRPARPTI